nr:hypothetical protein CFP56_21793 [Quercus suber]
MADYDRESSLGLQQLDPSPVEETPDGKESEYFSRSDASAAPSHHALGLSHSTIWYLSRITRYSSYAFSVFAAAHIANTSIIPIVTRSVPESERYLLLTRPYYQGLPAEPLLVIIPLWTHVLSAVALRLYRRHLNTKRYGDKDFRSRKGFFSSEFWPKVSGVSKLGFLLMPLLAGHIVVNRAVPNNFPGGSSNINLSYVSHAFAKHPAVSFAGFASLLTVGCWHITWGWAQWLGWTPNQMTVLGPGRQLAKRRRWYILNVVAATITGVWMAGSFGVIARGGEAPGWVGRLYSDMYRTIPIVGRWM